MKGIITAGMIVLLILVLGAFVIALDPEDSPPDTSDNGGDGDGDGGGDGNGGRGR